MLTLSLTRRTGDPPRLLCLGAHADDIEIGVGGALLRWLEEGLRPAITWIVFSADDTRQAEAEASAQHLRKTFDLDSVTLHVYDHRESHFPSEFSDIKERFEALKSEPTPDLIFTHYRNDRHQDHRVIADLTWNTFRDHLVLEYEVPKYDGDLGQPNVFVPLTPSHARAKSSWICDTFVSQRPKRWFGEDTFLALMRIRGVEAACEYAEGFYGRKILL